MNSNKFYTISEFIDIKNKELDTKNYDGRIVRFKEALIGISSGENGEYDLLDLERAWSETASQNCYDDRGLFSI